MARLELTLLGPCRFYLDRAIPAHVESNKARALLAFLAVEYHHPRTRDGLADLLWPDCSSYATRSNFRRTLANIRHVIGDHTAQPPHLLVSRETVQFNIASDVVVDAVRFIQLVKTQEAQPGLLENLEQAIALYQGPFLDGLALNDCPDFEQWMITTRNALEQLASRAYCRLAYHQEKQLDFDNALSLFQRCLTFDPYDEEAERGVMRSMASTGHRNAAIEHYNAFRRQLLADLDVEPELATAKLLEAIQRGYFAVQKLPVWHQSGVQSEVETSHTILGWEYAPWPAPPVHGHTQPASPSSPHHEALHPHTPFFGREGEQTHIAACLADPDCRLLTVLGPGGAGKTRLAVEAVAGQEQRFVDRVHFVSLAATDYPSHISDAILRALDAPVAVKCAAMAQLQDFLRDRQMLLILDNFEHLVDGAELLLEMLAAAPRLKLLVTSCTRLNLRDEWLAPIEGLETPPADFLSGGSEPAGILGEPASLVWAELERYSAIQLFLHGVRRLRPGFQPTVADAPVIVRICQVLEGLPLSIEMATAWTRTLSFAAILDGIEQNLDFLSTSLRDLPERQHSLRAILDHSWQLLTPHQRSLLRQIAVFPNSISAAEAAAVAGASLGDLAELVDRSWLHVGTDGHFAIRNVARRYCTARDGQ